MKRKALCAVLAGLFMLPAQVRAGRSFFSDEQKQAAGNSALAGIALLAAAGELRQLGANSPSQLRGGDAYRYVPATEEEKARIRAEAEANLRASKEREVEAQAESRRQRTIARARTEWQALSAMAGDARSQRVALVNAMLDKDYRDSKLLQDPTFAPLYRAAIELYLDSYSSPELKVLALAQSGTTDGKRLGGEFSGELRALYVARLDAELILLSVRPATVFDGSPAAIDALVKVVFAKAAAWAPLSEALRVAQDERLFPPGAPPFPPTGKRTPIIGTAKAARKWAAYDEAAKRYEDEKAAYQNKKAASEQRVAQAEAAATAARAALDAALKDLAAALKNVAATSATAQTSDSRATTLPGTEDLRRAE